MPFSLQSNVILLYSVLFRIEKYFTFEDKCVDFWRMICYIGYGINVIIKFNNVHFLGFLFRVQEGVLFN